MAPKDPRLVEALIEEAEQALDEDDLLRAEALAERAVALGPHNPGDKRIYH